MILLDISQTLISNIMISINSFPEINEEVIRYQVLHSIGSYNRKFRNDYGELVICCDSKPSWRKEIYPYYKANRAKALTNSKLDWIKITECIDTIIKELDKNFPYRVVKVETAEGDDVIATIVMDNSIEIINNGNKILIISADKDLSQLQKYPNVEQYDPIFTKNKIKLQDPSKFLKEHIIRGDVGDGIPNIMSKDNTFVSGIRQSPIYEKKLVNWLEEDISSFCTDEMLRNYKRNEKLIDLSFIPDTLQKSILDSFSSQTNKTRKNVVPYFAKHELSKLMKYIGDY